MSTSHIMPLYMLLAGGKSRRMGEVDKALMEFAGKPLMAHVIERAVPHGAPCVINANGDLSRFDSFNIPVVTDVIDGHAGPLAGVLSGLEHARDGQGAASHIVSLACDAPFVPRGLGAALMKAVENGADMAQAGSAGRRHPVFAIWPVSMADELRRAIIDEGIRKIDDFTARWNCAVVDFAPEGEGAPDPFLNLNTPQDFRNASESLR